LDLLNSPPAVEGGEREAQDSRAAATRPGAATNAPIQGSIIGLLVGFRDEGQTPLVMFPGQPGSAALAARATLDLHGAHIGRQTVLVFERGDAQLPIVTGLLRGSRPWPLREQPGAVEVDADGERLIVSARQQLVLRCGRASIVLTREGKVLIQGDFVSSYSLGVNRIKGGSVQLN
jgi:hypothetical protein